MLNITFTAKAWDDYLYWQETDKKILSRINALLKDTQRNPHSSGMGKGEFLRGNLSGFVSKRITQEHRMVFRIKEHSIEIVQLRFHY